jgi:hypothetical protein
MKKDSYIRFSCTLIQTRKELKYKNDLHIYKFLSPWLREKKKIKTSTGKRSNGQRIYKEKLRFQQSFNLFLSRFYELREIKQTNTQDQQDRGHGSKREKQMFYFRIKKDEICKLSLNDLGQV